MSYYVTAALYTMLGMYAPYTDPCTYAVDAPYVDELQECASGYEPFAGICSAQALAQCWVDGKDSE